MLVERVSAARSMSCRRGPLCCRQTHTSLMQLLWSWSNLFLTSLLCDFLLCNPLALPRFSVKVKARRPTLALFCLPSVLSWHRTHPSTLCPHQVCPTSFTLVPLCPMRQRLSRPQPTHVPLLSTRSNPVTSLQLPFSSISTLSAQPHNQTQYQSTLGMHTS